MKLLITLFISTLFVIQLNAQTTMCFKENHKSMATIENIKLDGGECNSTKSVKEMKKDGWKIDDIKIDNNNYIYLFKKSTDLTNIDMATLEAGIIKKLEAKKVEEKKIELAKIQVANMSRGKEFYIAKCQNCHGENAREEMYNSKPLISLSKKDFKNAIQHYQNGIRQDISMEAYANSMDPNDTKNTYTYIQSLK